MIEGAETEASAPGKLFLTGEYAVLEGAPAVLVPVAQRARARLSPVAKGKGEGWVTTTRAKRLTVGALTKEPLVAAVLSAVWDASGWRRERLLAGGMRLEADTSAFHARSRKLGLGSSAAIAVALVRCFCPKLEAAEVLRLAQKAHMKFQRGWGSGADVALAVQDRPIVYRGGKAQGARLPKGLQMLFIWTGVASRSWRMLSRLAQTRQDHPDRYLPGMQKLMDAAVAARRALRQGAEDFVAAVQDYDETLLGFSRATRLGAYSSTHLYLRKEVNSAGCVYKPSGAGGGDFGIAFATQPERLAALQARLGYTMNFLYQPEGQET